uniref:Uncharacterized protein n=1 Tax=Globisporangium ultimum (strain ATCC 200006 / CBS 805.95 / DAOM BR144) TaxID=431595 RepID=K3X794_GLOUD
MNYLPLQAPRLSRSLARLRCCCLSCGCSAPSCTRNARVRTRCENPNVLRVSPVAAPSISTWPCGCWHQRHTD